MSRFVRASKYRHVFGQSARKENSIENVKVTTSAWDTNLISASGQYLSINWAAGGGGAFAILPIPSPFSPIPHGIPTKLPDIIPLARAHSAPVLDTDWSPFNDSVCASGGEDGKILIWKVEASQFDGWGHERWVPQDFDPVSRISGSARKIGQVLFHPTAAHVLASASGDYAVKLWDLANTDEPVITINAHTDMIQGFAFNHTGNLLATTCRDRKLRIFDYRAGTDPVRITDGHAGIKGSRVVWMGDKDRIATTGFSKMSDRQTSVWETGSLNNVCTVNIDQSAGTIMPFWSDNGILFLAGKGDGNVRYYEYENDKLFALDEYKSSDPQRGMGFLPRRAVSVSDCEIARGLKVYGSTIEPISFIVPRKADSFQADIYPPAPSSEPALTASEFFSGKNAPPNLVDLETGAISAATPPTSGPGASSGSYASLATATIAAKAALPSKTVSAPPALEEARPQKQTSFSEPTPIASPAVATPVRAIEPEIFTASTPVSAAPGSTSDDSALASENAQLQGELRDAKAKIRNLELQVETLRANAQRAAKALQLE